MAVNGSRRPKSDSPNSHCFQSCSKEVQNVAGSLGPRNSASSRRPIHAAVARLEDQTAVHLWIELEVEVIL
jgi:hypothetical protein